MSGKRFTNKAAVCAVAASLLFFSCTSTAVEMPWEKGNTQNNIYAEYFNIGQAYEDLKNYSKAIEYYEKSMGHQDLNRTAYYKIGRCSALNRDFEKARTVYENLLAQDEENTALKLSLAYVQAMSGKLDDAEKTYGQLVLANPTDSSIAKNHISVLIALEKNQEAYQSFLKFKENFPEDKAVSEIEGKLKEYIQSLETEEKKASEDSANEKSESTDAVKNQK